MDAFKLTLLPYEWVYERVVIKNETTVDFLILGADLHRWETFFQLQVKVHFDDKGLQMAN